MNCSRCGRAEEYDDNLWDGLCASCYIIHLQQVIAGYRGYIRQLKKSVGAAVVPDLTDPSRSI